MISRLSATTLFAGVLMIASPLLTTFTNSVELFVAVPVAFYGLLTCVAGYISIRNSKWASISAIIAGFGLIISTLLFIVSWLAEVNDVFRIFALMIYLALLFMDFAIFSMLFKIEVFDYLESE